MLPTDSASVAIPVTFNWKTVTDADSFSLQVSLNISFDSLVYSKRGLSGTSQEVNGLSNLTTYYWRVAAINKYGNSEWSKTRRFTSAGPMPSIPELILPNNNSTNVSIPPILIWKSAIGAESYNVQLSKDSSFTSSDYYQSNITDTGVVVSGLSYPTQYFWHISATNRYSASGWSKTMNFTTMGPLPQTPILAIPVDNSNEISINPILSWGESKGAENYTLQVSTDNSFSGLAYYKSGITATSQQVSLPGALTLYYWRVIASNVYGTTTSNVWSFTTTLICGTTTISYSGKTYHTVEIGNQCWLKENLDVGTRINGAIEQTNNGVIEKYCYNDDPNNCTTYGGIYQWAETVQYQNGASNITSPNPPFKGNVQGICPSGWHIPDNGEFTNLATAVYNDGNALKREDQGNAQGIGTNTSGFSGLLSGCTVNGTSGDLGYNGNFWSLSENSATQAYEMWFEDGSNHIGLGPGIKVPLGFSVRCLKD